MQDASPAAPAPRRLLPKLLAVGLAVTAGCALIYREHMRAQPSSAVVDGGAGPNAEASMDVLEGEGEPIELTDDAGAPYLMGTKSAAISIPEGAEVYLPTSKSAPPPVLVPDEPAVDPYIFTSKSLGPVEVVPAPSADAVEGTPGDEGTPDPVDPRFLRSSKSLSIDPEWRARAQGDAPPPAEPSTKP